MAKRRKGSENETELSLEEGDLLAIRNSRIVKALDSAEFVELPAFSKYREEYFDDEAFRAFQQELLKNPESGDVIQGTGGLRKVRAADEGRGKGKSGGSRVIYFWAQSLTQFWLFTLYGKDEQENLTSDQKRALRNRLSVELEREEAQKKTGA